MQIQCQPCSGSPAPQSASGPATVKILRSVKEVERLRSFWCSSPGLRDSDIDIFLTVCRGSVDVLRPHVLVLCRGEKPETLAIGRIVRRRLPFRVGYVNLFNPLVNVMTFPYGGWRGDSSFENCELLVREIIKSLRNGEAELALLEHVNTDSALFNCAKHMPGILFRDHFSPVRPHYMRELPDSLEQLNASFSASERKRFRQITRKLGLDFPGQFEVVAFSNTAELAHLVRIVEEVAQKTWQRKLGGGFNPNAALLDFFKTQAENGWLRVYVLYLGGKPCAFWVGAVYQQKFYSDFTGYDPDYARYSPGTYLLSQMMEEFCSNGIREIDFGFSDEEYKRRFCNVIWQASSPHIFVSGPQGLKLNIMKVTATLLHEPTRAFLDRTKLIQKAKKIWRKAGGGAGKH